MNGISWVVIKVFLNLVVNGGIVCIVWDFKVLINFFFNCFSFFYYFCGCFWLFRLCCNNRILYCCWLIVWCWNCWGIYCVWYIYRLNICCLLFYIIVCFCVFYRLYYFWWEFVIIWSIYYRCRWVSWISG